MNQDAGWDEGVLQGLRRRRVIRVVVAYLAVCLGGLSVGGLLMDLYSAPEWAFRALLGAAALGFPVTVVLAWTYDVTPQGIVKTPEVPPEVPPGDAAPEWAWRVTVALGLLATAAAYVIRSALE